MSSLKRSENLDMTIGSEAYMRLLLDHVMVGHHSVRPEGSPAILEKLASRGPPALAFL